MIIGLTGGAASGKTLVSGELERLGAHVVDADLISREIYVSGSPVYNEVVREFGKGVLNKDGSVNRTALGGIIFSDPEKRLSLNRITHPAIIRIIRERVEELKERYGRGSLIVVDAALLIEAGLLKEVDKVVVVYADEKKQVERLMKKYGLSEEEAKRRVSSQMPLEEKKKYADYVIENNGTVEEAMALARELYKKLRRS